MPRVQLITEVVLPHPEGGHGRQQKLVKGHTANTESFYEGSGCTIDDPKRPGNLIWLFASEFKVIG